MSEIYLFWDKLNNTPEILGDDGEFYGYNEDVVAIDQGAPDDECRNWYHLEKRLDVTPLNTWQRFEVFDPELERWVPFDSARKELVQEIYKHSGVKNWKEVY